jgi:phosphatidate cytidylyltransferase
MLGGLLFVGIVVSVVAALQDWPAQTTVWYIAAFLLTVLSVFGDLTESMLKRVAGKKDSGAFLPGHGGILDRIDSLTATAPLFAIIVAIFGGFY